MTLWVHTFSGLAFDLLHPKPEQIAIADIAHSLAGIPRYTAHGRRAIPVAEHSINVAYQVLRDTGDRQLAWDGLGHDFHEAYLNDVSAPVKRAMRELQRQRVDEGLLNEARALWEVVGPHAKHTIERLVKAARGGPTPFDELDELVSHAVRSRLSMSLETPEVVKLVDLRMLPTEAPQALTWPPPRPWELPEGCEPYRALWLLTKTQAEWKRDLLSAIEDLAPTPELRAEAVAAKGTSAWGTRS